MTEEEFKKYAGKRTTGRVSGYDLSGGIIIGYTDNTYPNELLAIDANNGWTGPHWAHKAIITNKEHEKDYISGKKNYLWVTIDNVIMDEQKELDLTEILRGCEGVELWSDIFGKGKLESLNADASYKIKVSGLKTNPENDAYQYFTKYGRFYDCYPDGKCMLWPSETNRDWSTFKKPIKDDDWVVCGYDMTGFEIRKYFDTKAADFEYIIPYDKFSINLTEEELKKLSIV